jgi:hypothetical protein
VSKETYSRGKRPSKEQKRTTIIEIVGAKENLRGLGFRV